MMQTIGEVPRSARDDKRWHVLKPIAPGVGSKTLRVPPHPERKRGDLAQVYGSHKFIGGIIPARDLPRSEPHRRCLRISG